jgi:hypothetical protein
LGRPSKYPLEFRREAAQLVLTSDRSMADIARELGVHHNTLGDEVNPACAAAAVADRVGRPGVVDEPVVAGRAGGPAATTQTGPRAMVIAAAGRLVGRGLVLPATVVGKGPPCCWADPAVTRPRAARPTSEGPR